MNRTSSSQTTATQPAGLLGPALIANGAFSALSGLVLAIAPATVSGWLGVDIPGWLRLFGIVLIGHAALIAFVVSVSQRPERSGDLGRWGLLNLVAIAPYPLLMIIAAIAAVPRDLGRLLVLADGAIIGVFAVAQWMGLRGRRLTAAAAG